MTPNEPAAFTLRPAEPADIRAAFAIFRRSIRASVHRMGLADSPDVTDANLDEDWVVRSVWIEHLWRTAAENWLAIDPDGRPIGWALSVQRGSMLQLTFFFVEPGVQSKGVGRALLERAFPPGRGPHRSIMATQDPRALSLYLRSGVRYVSPVVDFEGRPRPVSVDTNLVFERLDPSPASVDLVASVEEQLIGYRREIDTALMLERRPAWIARRAGSVAGFAFGHLNELTGPIGALDPADMPAFLAHVENEAAAEGATKLFFSTPLLNDAAVQHLLGRGYTIDPFVMGLLADDRTIKADRWIHFGLSYIL